MIIRFPGLDLPDFQNHPVLTMDGQDRRSCYGVVYGTIYGIGRAKIGMDDEYA